ncbi:MAG: hypothetical protein Q9M28_06710 [Mariprofundaceae bacterium]|nr:hypothetical protein [Mariprofundaceae bacterium]
MESSYFLFVFEGEKTEPAIFESLCKNFIKGDVVNTMYHCVYGTDIYDLYETSKLDENLDLLVLLRDQVTEKPQAINQKVLQGIHRDDISEIFLFFDYDGQAKKADDEKISKMLQFFDNETEHGQLFISYPSAEALRHMHKDTTFQHLVTDAKSKNYKKCVNNEGEWASLNIKKFPRDKWLHLIEQHACKANHIIYGQFVYPQQARVEQTLLFQQQKEKYIDPHKKVAVLSSFPLFIIEHFPDSEFQNKPSGK